MISSQHADALIATVAAHLPYMMPEVFTDLRLCLASGVSSRRAWMDLPMGKLRDLLIERPEVWDLAERDREWCFQHDAEILHPWHPLFPERLLALDRPPVFLSLRGKPAWMQRPGISIIGSREPTAWAVEWLEIHLMTALRNTGVYTVSGGARGVDQKAHALSLRAELPTIAFLPSGLAKPYPADIAGWLAPIHDSGGGMVSEFPPMREIARAHFERRNRLIAGLGHCLFVVEAARKSGSMMTARLALESGRPICALPASPLESCAAGTVDLLFDGATLIRDAEDLVTFINGTV